MVTTLCYIQCDLSSMSNVYIMLMYTMEQMCARECTLVLNHEPIHESLAHIVKIIINNNNNEDILSALSSKSSRVLHIY